MEVQSHALNGIVSGSLGKRKREHSQDNADSHQDTQPLSEPQKAIGGFLQLLRNYDPTPSLLRHPLKSSEHSTPETKRTRLSNSEVNDNIEERMQRGTYKTLEQLIRDVNEAAADLLHPAHITGGLMEEAKSSGHVDAKTRAQISSIQSILNDSVERGKKLDSATKKMIDLNSYGPSGLPASQANKQVLTLRTATEKGPRQVYSGLQLKDSDSLDGKTLPNGFDIMDASSLSAYSKPSEPKLRTLGDVFQPRGRLRALDPPRLSRDVAHESTIKFRTLSQAIFDIASRSPPPNSNSVRMPSSQWVRYGSEVTQTRQQEVLSLQKQESGESKTDALFQATYSSFAPTRDSSAAVYPETVRNRLWWSKKGRAHFEARFGGKHTSKEDQFLSTNSDNPMLELSTLAGGYPSEDTVSLESATDPSLEAENIDDLLEEVSAMIETLSSYQEIRDLKAPKPMSTLIQPLEPEYDTFEILRSQLALMIASLPPFAVAKLDGDQLEHLNISTNVLVDNYDHIGSGDTNLYKLRYQQDLLSATPTASRPAITAAAPLRPAAYIPVNTLNAAGGANPYTPRPGMYGTNNINSTASSYSARPPSQQSFQQPRPLSTTPRPAFSQQPYQPSSTPSYTQPTAQQFQRPLQNGYVNYANSGTPQASYLQRPSQPAYQQKAQETGAVYGHSASPQKPLVNGHVYTTPQQSPPALPPSARPQSLPQGARPPGSFGTPNTPMMYPSEVQRQKFEQPQPAQAQLAQRQVSGTPQPALTPGSSGYGRYDGVLDGGPARTPSVSAEPKREMSASTPTAAP